MCVSEKVGCNHSFSRSKRIFPNSFVFQEKPTIDQMFYCQVFPYTQRKELIPHFLFWNFFILLLPALLGVSVSTILGIKLYIVYLWWYFRLVSNGGTHLVVSDIQAKKTDEEIRQNFPLVHDLRGYIYILDLLF